MQQTTTSKDVIEPAQLAKAALRRLALAKREPTPGNFARAWREEGGPLEPEAPAAEAGPAIQAIVRRLMPPGEGRDALAKALGAGRWDEAGKLVEARVPAPDDQARTWAGLIDRSVRGVARASKSWPMGRRRDSLGHVLEASRSDPFRLQQRLGSLLASWDGEAGDAGDVGDAAAATADVPTTVPTEQATAHATAVPTALPTTLPTDVPVEQAVAQLAAVVAAAAERSEAQAADAANAGVEHPLDRPTEPVPLELLPNSATVTAGARIRPSALDIAVEPPAPVVPDPHWPRAVQVLEATLQSALPPGEPRAGEVGSRLAEVAGALRAEVRADGQLVDALHQACDEVRLVLQHRHHLVDQIGGLVRELTDGLGELAEDDSWVEGQCIAMRDHIGMGLSTRGVSAVSQLLASTRARQTQLRLERRQARDALKEMIHRMLQDIGELGVQTGRFNDSVGRYASVIGQAESLESLAGIVREMVDETRAVHQVVSQTTQRLHDEHARAAEMAERVRQLEDELRQLSQEVGTDQLTQVANRRGLLRQFEVEQSRIDREGITLAVGLLDIDNFKRLNDTLGHNTGDEALKFLARRVGEMLRPTDTLARYGGEEFVVLLPATEVEEARSVLTRVQRLMSAELFMHENKQTFVTFSAGVTLFRRGEALEAALQRADEALYEAKRTGKNRTCAA
ncbi:diguanylate cyclase domain-containing protein [Leptothrix discophora]|uniref:diguanylate cyclase n=1 Tax=Leptothrix discophora TaxID=89 RepID=A0ABT9FY23_LEPDI|nr:diguanylate cyclase [Leptothrix discophora]MDP4299152.1 diguanylate cyclase [Leptothrix discophora]